MDAARYKPVASKLSKTGIRGTRTPSGTAPTCGPLAAHLRSFEQQASIGHPKRRSHDSEPASLAVLLQAREHDTMTETIQVRTRPRGSILAGMIWMAIISILLFWLPGIGSLIAGFVGGMKAGGVWNGIMAVFLPALLLAGLLFFFGSALTGIPIIGAIAGMGVFVLIVAGIGPLLVGAIIGGVLA